MKKILILLFVLCSVRGFSQVVALTGKTQAAGVNYTHTTASSGDWGSVANDTYFYDLTDELAHYKDGTGTVVNLFSSGGGNMATGNLTSTGTYSVTMGGRAWTLDDGSQVIRGVYDNKFTPSADIDFIQRLKSNDGTTIFGIASYNGYTDMTTLPLVAMYDCNNFVTAGFSIGPASTNFTQITPLNGTALGLSTNKKFYVTGTGNGIYSGSSVLGLTGYAVYAQGALNTFASHNTMLTSFAGDALFNVRNDASTGIGTTAISGQRLTVKGSGNTSGTTSLLVENLAGTDGIVLDGANNLTLGEASLGTAATDGFAAIGTCAGVPTGVPTVKTGYAQLVIDITNGKMYFYSTTAVAWVILN